MAYKIRGRIIENKMRRQKIKKTKFLRESSHGIILLSKHSIKNLFILIPHSADNDEFFRLKFLFR